MGNENQTAKKAYHLTQKQFQQHLILYFELPFWWN